MALNLMLHCGANAVERNALSGQVLPPATDSFQPLAHDYFADMVQDELENVGLRVVGEAHGINPSGSKYFGLFEVRGQDAANDYSTVIGMRNSNTKRFSAAVAVGGGVFVCDNMAFTGDIIVGHKHTTNVQDALRNRIRNVMQDVLLMEANQVTRYEAYKEKKLETRRAENLVIEMLRRNVISTHQLPKVVQQWDEPDHEQFARNNVWKLFNAVTESYKGTGIETIQRRSPELHNLLDDYAGVELAVAA